MLKKKVLQYIQKHGLVEEGDRVVVAVSGGPDSLCLLHLLNSLSGQLGFDLVVAHLNHGMRPEATCEAESVRDLAASWSLPFVKAEVGVYEYASKRGLSLEEAARILRYRFLLKTARRLSASKIAVGHHRDDQVETVLFNLLRGTGPDGLAGMLPCREMGSVRLIRPLLHLSRRDIERYCQEKQLIPALDASNLQAGYTRNRIRLELIPHLEARYNPRVKEALARLATLAAEDRRYLQAQAHRALKAVSRLRGNRLLISRARLGKLPEALRGRVIRLALEDCLPGKQVQWIHVFNLLKVVKKTGPVREISLPGSMRAYITRNYLIISEELSPAKTIAGAITLQIPGVTSLPGNDRIEALVCRLPELTWPPSPGQACLDFDLLTFPLTVKARWTGARFFPQGAPGEKKLKDFFIDQKVPAHRRNSWPLVVNRQEEIIWVTGIRIAHPYRVTGGTKNVLLLKWHKAGS